MRISGILPQIIGLLGSTAAFAAEIDLKAFNPDPVPLPSPVLAPSDVPVPVPREGVPVRTGRGEPPLSSNVGLARVLFWSVGAETSTAGSSLEATVCACAAPALKARNVVARKTARRLAAVVAEDMVRTSV